MQETRRKRSETTRVQRAHLLVAIGVIGAFATFYNPSEDPIQLDVFWTASEPIYALLIHVVLFMAYIPAHLYTITAWTLPTETRLDKLHDLVLPFANLFLLLGSLPLVLMIILNIDFSALPSVRIAALQTTLFSQPISESVYPASNSFIILAVTPVSYILVEIIVFAYPAYRYARAFEENMSNIQTGSRSRRLHLSTGSSGDSARVTITNSNDQEVSGEDIKLEIDTPRGVIVEDVRHATEADSGYRLVDDLAPDESIRLPIELGEIPGVKYDDYRGEEVEVDVFIHGEKTSTERFTL
ncbi:hypothetical protein B1756_14365 [Natrarchaeobaculum aegyptiacum]|uniref:Uncharacterized protein n=2 Tax=Natrarchaeobaculum aegyptiacum TaxID=745377 RepID=A0A2Z2HYF0_9EURY|nr:hypothetical protein B1756_14365 [Natrarchaeobaculum aegyptiacum]